MATARLAPTPSGYLHAGNLANFLLNARLAGPGGGLLLRIDDLDRGRYRRRYVADIFTKLSALGIAPTQGPRDVADFEQHWSQEHRMPLYTAALRQLREQDRVFACACSRRELAGGEHKHGCLEGNVSLDAPGVAWRINTRGLQPVAIPDVVRPEDFILDVSATTPDVVIRRKNGRPSYQLACVVDDYHFKIDAVGRGEDLLGSTAAQIVISQLLGQSLLHQIRYLHHPLLTTTAGDKLSKSAGHGSEGERISAAEINRLHALVDGWLKGRRDVGT